MSKNNKSTAQFRNGNLKSCIWQNKAKKKNGKTTLRNSISIQKSFKDPKSGEWINYELQLFKEWGIAKTSIGRIRESILRFLSSII